MARASASLRWLAGKEQALAGVHSGIAPATVSSYGYHNNRQRHLAGITTYGPRDYSVQQASDRRGDAALFSAIDWSHSAANMRLYTGRLIAAADRGDPRMRFLREFYGTVDNRTVVGRIHDSPDGAWRESSADLSHLSHIHKSFLREYAGSQFAAEAVFSVERGEPLTSWLARTSSGGDLSMPVPSGRPLLRAGSSGLEVRSLQAALNEALNLRLTVDGQFGPATEAAVKTLQRAAGLTADGIYGPATANALTEELSMPTADEIAEAIWKRINPTLGISYGAMVRYILNGVRPDQGQTGSRLGVTAAVDHVGAQVEALTAAVAGQDVVAAVRTELDRHRTTLLDTLADQLTDQLAQRLAELPAERDADQLRQAVIDAVSRVRVTVDQGDS